MSDGLERRARAIRSRAAVRAWEYRQRKLSKGVWYRLRRVLVEAREAHAISGPAALALMDEGARAEPVGQELHPPKYIVWTTPDRIARVPEAQRVPLRLGPEVLGAEGLALVPFE